jgi:hypothetical protein
MASTGQASMHAPQSIQESGSMAALPSTMLIALLGHSSTHDSHPVHFALSISAGIQLSFQKTTANPLENHGIIANRRPITTQKSSKPVSPAAERPYGLQHTRRSADCENLDVHGYRHREASFESDSG